MISILYFSSIALSLGLSPANDMGINGSDGVVVCGVCFAGDMRPCVAINIHKIRFHEINLMGLRANANRCRKRTYIPEYMILN